ncbi:MAG: hypothetical protein WB587_13905 [Nitrososphaeraceae archaeon]
METNRGNNAIYDTELLEVAVTEHMQRCEGKNEGDRINYTISNTDIHIEFPNRSGIC